jgi:tubulin-specific chaperone B
MAMERAAMRAYVTGADHLQFTQLADGMVQVNATHSNLKQFVMELRFDLASSIAEVKRKLFTHNGTGVEHMELHLRSADGTPLCRMLDDDRPLGYYGVENGMEIHVVDTDPYSLSRDGGLDDVSKVAKYRMSEEDYDKRENTLRAYKRKMLEKDPTFKFVPANRRPAAGGAGDEAAGAAGGPDYTAEGCVEGIEVGARTLVAPGARRGTVAWVGKDVAGLAPGYWVGVRLDEPLAKGDGTRGGVSYFDAPAKHGAFVRPDVLTLGDYPPLFDELEEEGDGVVADAGAGGAAAPAAAGGKTALVDTTAATVNAGGCAAPSDACCGHDHSAAGSAVAAAPAADAATSAAPPVAAAGATLAEAAPAAAAAVAGAAAPAPARKAAAGGGGGRAAVGGMRRVGGARRDADSDDEGDDEL